MHQKQKTAGNYLVQKTYRKIALSAGLCRKKENHYMNNPFKNNTLTPSI
jgi:hypothetical protein